jgi:hypothetical protein
MINSGAAKHSATAAAQRAARIAVKLPSTPTTTG